MKTVGCVVAVALAAAVGACSHNNQSAGAESAQAQAYQTASCPVSQLPGVHATVADTQDGVAVTFTGPQNELDQLRQGVKTMASTNEKQGSPFAMCPCAFNQTGSAEQMPGGPSAQGNTWGGGAGNTAMQPSAIPADSKVEQIPTGAVLMLTPKDKSQAQALRDEVRTEVTSMKQNGCLSRSQ